jgi:peptide deformylase
MEIQVIPDQQTPVVPEFKYGIKNFLTENMDKLKAFKEFAQSQDNAAGLAANQVSIDGQRFMERLFAYRTPDGTMHLMINPNVNTLIGMKEMHYERCLTWKDKLILAERSRAIDVGYYDENGEYHIGIYKGFDAQVWQHEINHLNGIEEKVITYNDWKEIKRQDVGRNEKCPCGSGKKYKHCCLLLLVE